MARQPTRLGGIAPRNRRAMRDRNPRRLPTLMELPTRPTTPKATTAPNTRGRAAPNLKALFTPGGAAGLTPSTPRPGRGRIPGRSLPYGWMFGPNDAVIKDPKVSDADREPYTPATANPELIKNIREQFKRPRRGSIDPRNLPGGGTTVNPGTRTPRKPVDPKKLPGGGTTVNPGTVKPVGGTKPKPKAVPKGTKRGPAVKGTMSTKNGYAPKGTKPKTRSIDTKGYQTDPRRGPRRTRRQTTQRGQRGQR